MACRDQILNISVLTFSTSCTNQGIQSGAIHLFQKWRRIYFQPSLRWRHCAMIWQDILLIVYIWFYNVISRSENISSMRFLYLMNGRKYGWCQRWRKELASFLNDSAVNWQFPCTPPHANNLHRYDISFKNIEYHNELTKMKPYYKTKEGKDRKIERQKEKKTKRL